VKRVRSCLLNLPYLRVLTGTITTLYHSRDSPLDTGFLVESTVDGQGKEFLTVRRPSLLTPSKSSVSRGVRALQIFLPAKTARQSPSLFIVSTYLAPLLHIIPPSILLAFTSLPSTLRHPPTTITIHHHPLYSISAIRNPHLWTFGPLVSVARANIRHPPAHCLSIHHSSFIKPYHIHLNLILLMLCLWLKH
jgi:hypothetical protein